MDRFVAMIWDQKDLTRQSQIDAWSETLPRQSRNWARVLDRPGLRVFCYHHRGDEPVVTRWDGDDGVVIGPLFARGQEAKGRVLNLSIRDAGRVAASRGEALIKGYWGNYVAIWQDVEKRQTIVLRDPCAAVPCFMTRQLGVELLFAHAEDVADFPGLHFNIDWTFLQAFILHAFFVTRRSGLQEVSELMGGERLELSSDGTRILSWAWDAARIAAEPDFRCFEDIRNEIREIMEACFTAWGKEYRNVVVMLSGGLDSSSVMKMLRRVSDAKIVGLHYVGASYEEYEVKLARKVAEQAGAELIEVKTDTVRDDLTAIFGQPRYMYPMKGSVAVAAGQLAQSVAQRVGADCFMTGKAGDTLFLQRGIAERTLADFVKLRGFGPGFGRAAYSAAMLRHKSIWAVSGEALMSRPWRPYAYLDEPKAQKQRALTAGAERSIPSDYMLHPWLAEATQLPPGKADHLSSIIALSRMHVFRGYGLAHDVISAFHCQPVVEAVLRTPTYMFCDGGVDRSLERRVFEDIVPDEIVRRTDKGGAVVATNQSMRANLNFFRSVVLDGELVRQGWFDRAKLEAMLSPDGLTRGGAIIFIYTLAAAEAWIKSWRFDGERAAA